MVWIEILREMGAAYNAYDYNWDAEDDLRADPSDIDIVPEGYAGCLNQQALRAAANRLGSPCLKFGTHVLQSGQSFHASTKPDTRTSSKNHRRATFSMYLMSLWILWTWCILQPATHEEIRHFSVFFTVPKSNGHQRTIMDCRDLNATSARPPPIKLGQMGETLTKAAELGCTIHIQADISHYFHLFGLPFDIRSYFGLQCLDKETGCNTYFTCKTMPMGWSWAPHIAQASTFTAILSQHHRLKDDLGLDYDEIKSWEHIPAYVELKDNKGMVVGFIQVVYDNIGIFLSDEKLAAAWIKKLKLCAEIFNIHWKEMYYLDERGVFNVLDNKPVLIDGARSHCITFLGAEIQVKTAEHPFRWRHDAKKLSKWRPFFTAAVTNAKDVSKVVGVLVWDCIINLVPFSSITEQIDVLRGVSRLMKKKSDWNRDFTGDTLKELQTSLPVEKLRVMYDDLALNPWRHTENNTQREVYFLASDATETSIAGVVLNEHGQVVNHFAKVNMPYTHIYTKEVLAIVATVQYAQRLRRKSTPATFKIAVDNKAAAAACMRCYSSCPGMNRTLLNLWSFMKTHNIHLQCVDIHTKLNVADLPSRRRPITKKLARATINVLTGKSEGRPQWLQGPETVGSDYLPEIQDIEDAADSIWTDMQRTRHIFSLKRSRH